MRTFSARLGATLLLAGCLAVLGIAVYVRPDPHGFGTHTQLGIGPCGMLIVTGYPCPTCGMTTAFAYTVRGHWLQAAYAQFAGFVFALATFAALPFAGWVLVGGRWPRWQMFWLTPYRLFFALLVLLLGGWGLKIVIGLVTHTLPWTGPTS